MKVPAFANAVPMLLLKSQARPSVVGGRIPPSWWRRSSQQQEGLKLDAPQSRDPQQPPQREGEAGDTLLCQGALLIPKLEVAMDEQLGAGLPLEFVSEEVLMNSGHELHESFTCLLCWLPIALPIRKHSLFKVCCMKLVCKGCLLALHRRGMQEKCPFCRTPEPKSDAARLALVQKRASAKDPVVIESIATAYYMGSYGLQQDIPWAIELWTEAARVGNLIAQCNLGCRYYYGKDVEQDVARGISHMQHAAIQGQPSSRYDLGYHEYENVNHELAVRHWMISAKMGYEISLDAIKIMFTRGHATEAQYAEALRSYQNAVEATESTQREEAKAVLLDEGD